MTTPELLLKAGAWEQVTPESAGWRYLFFGVRSSSFASETGEAEGEIIVETDSGESGNDGRDRRMKNDVLESTRYPEAIFHPAKVTGVVGAGKTQTVTVEGTFTIHGADHPLILDVKTALNGGTLTAKTSFVVPYVDWGMKDPSTLMLRVGKSVQVDVDAQATLK